MNSSKGIKVKASPPSGISNMEVFSPQLGGAGGAWDQGSNTLITKITSPHSQQLPATISLEQSDNDRRKRRGNGGKKSNVPGKGCNCGGWLRASQVEHDLQELVSVHGNLLTGLHTTIDGLKQKNRDLTFQLLMGPYASGVKTEVPLSPESEEALSPKNEQRIEVLECAKKVQSSSSANITSPVLPVTALPNDSTSPTNPALNDTSRLLDLQDPPSKNSKPNSESIELKPSSNIAINNTSVLPNIKASPAILISNGMVDQPDSSSTAFNKNLKQKNQQLKPLQEENVVVIKRSSRGRATRGDPRLVRSLDLEILEIEADDVRRQLEEERAKNKYLNNLIDDLKRQVSRNMDSEQQTDPKVRRGAFNDLSPPKDSVLPPPRPPPRPSPRTTTLHHRSQQLPHNTSPQRRMFTKDNNGSSQGLASHSPVRSTSTSRSSGSSQVEARFPSIMQHSPSRQDHSLHSARNSQPRSRGRKQNQRSTETKEMSAVTPLPAINGIRENSPKRTQEEQHQLTNGPNIQEQRQNHQGSRARQHGRGRARNRYHQHQQQQYQQQDEQRAQGKTKEMTQSEGIDEDRRRGTANHQQPLRRPSSLRRMPGARQKHQQKQQESPEPSHEEHEHCETSESRAVSQQRHSNKHGQDSTLDDSSTSSLNSSWEQKQQSQATAVASAQTKQEPENKTEGRKGRGRHHRRGRGRSRKDKIINNQEVPNED